MPVALGHVVERLSHVALALSRRLRLGSWYLLNLSLVTSASSLGSQSGVRILIIKVVSMSVLYPLLNAWNSEGQPVGPR